VDQLLIDISKWQASIRLLSDDLEADMAVIRNRYAADIAAARQTVEALEKELEQLVKRHKAEILRGNDRADFHHGAVLLKIEKRVKRIRKMLVNLEAAGRDDLVKTVKSVDWDSVEKLTDQELKDLGTLRKPQEVFSYEIR
jgi:phage host-nuclease inhibitor protein Gam